MKTTFLFAEPQNIVGVLEALKTESLEDGTRICIDAKLVKKITKMADKTCMFHLIEEILWNAECNKKGFMDLRESNNGWTRVLRINSGSPVFTEKPSVPASHIIYIS